MANIMGGSAVGVDNFFSGADAVQLLLFGRSILRLGGWNSRLLELEGIGIAFSSGSSENTWWIWELAGTLTYRLAIANLFCAFSHLSRRHLHPGQVS